MQKLKKYMGLSSIAVAIVFLFNPNMNLIDVLPDFIGYAILCTCLSQLSDINEDIATARVRFGRLLALDLIKFFSVFFIFGASQNDEQNTMILLVSFSFAVIESVMAVPAYVNLFGGLINLGYKFENNSVLKANGKRTRKNRTEKIAAFTYFFVVFKAMAYALPEFSVLASQTYDESSQASIYLYDFVGVLRGFSMFVTFIVGIVWLIRTIRYFSTVKKDKLFIDALSREYSENILPKKSLFVRKTVKLVFILLGVASLLCMDFRVEYFNLIPDTVAAVVLIIAAIIAKKYVPSFAKYFIPFFAYAAVSLGAQIVEYRFFSEFFYSAVVKNENAYNAYNVMLVTSVLDAVSFVIAVVGMTVIFKWVIKEHTGFSVPDASLRTEEKIRKVHERLNKKLFIFYAGALLCVASDLFYDFGAKDFGFAGIANTVCTLIFFICFYHTSNEIYDEVESKYMLE